ncbi:MAG: FmdB family zinc ribbon protein [Polaromonas sp.]
MPIYAYKCESCGYAKDALQKLSDAPLTDCPQCGASSFKKQLTAAGFQLKGSGWYVTDFRGDKGGSKADKPAAADAAATAGDSAASKAPLDGGAKTAPVVAAPAASAAAPASQTSSGDSSSRAP